MNFNTNDNRYKLCRTTAAFRVAEFVETHKLEDVPSFVFGVICDRMVEGLYQGDVVVLTFCPEEEQQIRLAYYKQK